MKKLAALTALLVAGSWLTWRLVRPADKPENRLFFNRPWIDHMPRNETDVFSLFIVVTEEPVGGYLRQSQWKGEHEFFRYDSKGDGRVDVVFPQNRSRERLTYKVSRCHEREFDLCLDVTGGSRGPKRYFSREEWEIGAHAVDPKNGTVRLPAPLRNIPAE